MKIAVDISPIDEKSQSAHKIRGVGKYITILKDNLERFDKHNKYIFTSSPKEAYGADLVHYPYFDPFFIDLPLNNKKTTLVTVHDIIPLVHKKQFPVGIKGELKWRINKFLLKKASGIITDSNASKEDIRKVTAIDNKKIYPVYLAVDDEFRITEVSKSSKDELQKKFNLPDKFLLYVGDVTWNKNLVRLVKAVKQIDVPLVMVGKALIEAEFDKSNPWNKERVEVLAETENNSLFIRPGFVPTSDLVKFYNMSEALLMPSLDEGFGFPVLEAMRCGCPVVTSSCGSLPEIAGHAAVIVDAYSVDDIVSGIKNILNDNYFKARMVKEGLLQSEKFTLEKMIKDTVSIYNLHEKKN